VTNTADGFRLQFPGVSESFELSTEHDELPFSPRLGMSTSQISTV